MLGSEGGKRRRLRVGGSGALRTARAGGVDDVAESNQPMGWANGSYLVNELEAEPHSQWGYFQITNCNMCGSYRLTISDPVNDLKSLFTKNDFKFIVTWLHEDNFFIKKLKCSRDKLAEI